MYNIRRKLTVLTVLLFIIAFGVQMVYPKTEQSETIATESVSEQITGSPFDEQGEKFVAHRGYSNYVPENSIPAFEFAGKMGFWGIETDICQTNDNQFVCMHDESIDRTTNGSGTVGDYSLEQLREFNIDKGKNLNRSENLKIPTMNEYLDICKQYKCVAVVEIKSISDYDSFLKTIIDSGMENRCIIAGPIEEVKEIRARNNVIPVMTLGYHPAPYTDSLAAISEISENRGVLYNYPQIDKSTVDILHQQNIYCGVWTVDETDIAQQYIDYGVDFIVTNEIPARLSYLENENE